MVYNTA